MPNGAVGQRMGQAAASSIVRYFPFFFISGLHPVAPQDAAGSRFAAPEPVVSMPASTTALVAGGGAAAVGVDAVVAAGADAGFAAVASGAGAEDSVLLQPMPAFTESTASAARIASKESVFTMKRS
jgi:hypothetical protein